MSVEINSWKTEMLDFIIREKIQKVLHVEKGIDDKIQAIVRVMIDVDYKSFIPKENEKLIINVTETRNDSDWFTMVYNFGEKNTIQNVRSGCNSICKRKLSQFEVLKYCLTRFRKKEEI